MTNPCFLFLLLITVSNNVILGKARLDSQFIMWRQKWGDFNHYLELKVLVTVEMINPCFLLLLSFIHPGSKYTFSHIVTFEKVPWSPVKCNIQFRVYSCGLSTTYMSLIDDITNSYLYLNSLLEISETDSCFQLQIKKKPTKVDRKMQNFLYFVCCGLFW